MGIILHKNEADHPTKRRNAHLKTVRKPAVLMTSVMVLQK